VSVPGGEAATGPWATGSWATGPWPYLLFTLPLLALGALDLGLATRRRGPPTMRSAVAGSLAWVGVALGFGLWVANARGRDDGLAFLAAYLTEASLSLDNMVVYVAVFAYFGVPGRLQQRVLLWGILGAIVMRGLMIAAGLALLERIAWITYAFGAFLLVAGLRMLRARTPSRQRGGRLLRLVARLVPVVEPCGDATFLRRVGGRLAVTPLLVTLLVIELSDAVFATDSLPAVFGVTRDPFLVYTSNLLAVMGLRHLYFLVAGALPRLRYLRYGLAAILVFVGAKMLAADVVAVPAWVSLVVIAMSIGAATAASFRGGHLGAEGRDGMPVSAPASGPH
jgi:tellurite resistance protein TerC